MQKNIKVSVCIPTFNYAQFLPETINSVLQQTAIDHCELVIVDNASTDNTEEVIKEWTKKTGRLRYYRNDTNLGMVKNWNRCLEHARGEYIKVLCADDLLEPECIQRGADILDRHPEVSLVSCSRMLFNDNNDVVQVMSFTGKPGPHPGRKIIKYCVRKGNMIGEPTAVMFRANAATRGFNLDYNQFSDLEMWLHLLEKGDFYYDPAKLCRFRQHPEQCTNQNKANLTDIQDRLGIIRDYAHHGYNKLRAGLIEYYFAGKYWKRISKDQGVKKANQKLAENYGLLRFHLLRKTARLWKKIVF